LNKNSITIGKSYKSQEAKLLRVYNAAKVIELNQQAMCRWKYLYKGATCKHTLTDVLKFPAH